MAGSRTKNRESRAERARATQAKVVDAAVELFVGTGYLQTTMADIARTAGVSVQTLYLSFGGKGAVLSAAMDVTIAGDDEPVPIVERAWHQEMREEPDGRRAYGHFLAASSTIIQRFYPLYAAIRAAAADPEVADLLDRNKRERFTTFRAVVEELSGKQGYAEGLAVDRAAEMVYTQQSEETYGLLVVERGWPAGDWSTWVEHHVAAELFPVVVRDLGQSS
jgi:AcrR family transcriptional regulator